MLNVFPHLLDFSFIAPLLLRIALGVTLFTIGRSMITTKLISVSAYFEAQEYPIARFIPWFLGYAAIVTGIFCVLGFFTQIASLVAIYILLNMMFIEHRDERVFEYSQVFYLIMIVIASSLVFSGSGLVAIDALI